MYRQVEQAGEKSALGYICGGKPSPSDVAAAVTAINATLLHSKMATAELWVEMRVWAEAVFQSVHQQFSVPIYGGEYTRRGRSVFPLFLRFSIGKCRNCPLFPCILTRNEGKPISNLDLAHIPLAVSNM